MGVLELGRWMTSGFCVGPAHSIPPFLRFVSPLFPFSSTFETRSPASSRLQPKTRNSRLRVPPRYALARRESSNGTVHRARYEMSASGRDDFVTSADQRSEALSSPG